MLQAMLHRCRCRYSWQHSSSTHKAEELLNMTQLRRRNLMRYVLGQPINSIVQFCQEGLMAIRK